MNSSLEADGAQWLLPFDGHVASTSRQTRAHSDEFFDSPRNEVQLAARPREITGDGRLDRKTKRPDFRTAGGHGGASKSEQGWQALDSAPGRSIANRAFTKKVKLYGKVTQESREDLLGDLISDLVSVALSRNTNSSDIDKAVAHFHSRPARAASGVKDLANESLEYKGFGPSMEAADVILDHKIKAHSAASADYLKQRYVDQIHPKIVSKVMQIAMGMGLREKDQERGSQMILSGTSGLRDLVGDNETQATVAMLDSWTKTLKLPNAVFQQPPWDVDAFRDKVKVSTKLALNGDPAIEDITAKVLKYKRTALAKRSSGAVLATANLCEWISPGMVIPAGIEILKDGFIAGTGGTEQSKLLKELYLYKRIESRYRVVSEEVQLALTHYQVAVANHNTTLLACSESVLSQLVGKECIPDILGKSVFSYVNDPQQTSARVDTVQQ